MVRLFLSHECTYILLYFIILYGNWNALAVYLKNKKIKKITNVHTQTLNCTFVNLTEAEVFINSVTKLEEVGFNLQIKQPWQICATKSFSFSSSSLFSSLFFVPRVPSLPTIQVSSTSI